MSAATAVTAARPRVPATRWLFAEGRAGLLRHLRAARERQRGAGGRHGPLPARGRRRRDAPRHRAAADAAHDLRGRHRRARQISRSGSTSPRPRRSSPSARCICRARGSASKAATNRRASTQPSTQLVPRGRRDRLVLRHLRAAQQSERDAGACHVDVSAAGRPRPSRRRCRSRRTDGGRSTSRPSIRSSPTPPSPPRRLRPRHRRRARDVLADIAAGWQEAHNSFGVTEAGLRWGVADGRIGGPRDYQTYILLANPNPAPAEVQVRFLKAGVSATRTYTLPPTSRLNINRAPTCRSSATGCSARKSRC